MCRSREQAEPHRAALTRLRGLLAELGLEPKEAKTRIVHLQVGGEGVDFLGFHHRLVRAQGRRGTGKGLVFLARWPTNKAMQHARDRIRQLTGRQRLLLPVEEVVQDLNRFLRGWAGYFRYGNSARHFNQISSYASERVALVVAKRHGKRIGYGRLALARSPERYRLISLNGTVAAPRPHRRWRWAPNAAGERRR
jgi:hypothetical protein